MRDLQLLQSKVREGCYQKDQTSDETYTDTTMGQQVLFERFIGAGSEPTSDQFDFQNWPLDLLLDYLEHKHQALLRQRIPLVQKFLNRLVKLYGAQEPHLIRIKALFEDSTEDLRTHIQQEELIVFPFIRRICTDGSRKSLLLGSNFHTIKTVIFQLMGGHNEEEACLEEIRKLSNNYATPPHACNTYKMAFALLQEFDLSLKKHMFLENTILFPKAISLHTESRIN